MKDNNVGGPSIIFNRYQEKEKTKIRQVEMEKQGQEPKVCQKVIGYDANALYLWAIMQPMPTGNYSRRLADDGFKIRSSARMAIDRLEWRTHQRGIHIRHQLNNTEKRIGSRHSSYGKTITNKERHRQVKFCSDEEVTQLINSPFSRQLDAIDDDSYEVQSSKKNIKLDLPLQVGFFVYQYAKLRMLQFYYDFLDKYIDRRDFEFCEMDTDSAYIAISSDNIEQLIKPEMKEEYEKDKHNWFPRDDTIEHARYDKRTPGLFKIEWKGDGIIGLCSKTYYCFGNKDKFSCKGLNKKHNVINKEKYLNVIVNKRSGSGVNRGFRMLDNRMCTYAQEKNALSYFYPKRKVLEDGVSTIPLDI